jgi:hypothetical protein
MVVTLSTLCEVWYAGRSAKSPRLATIAHHLPLQETRKVGIRHSTTLTGS